jgi:hypothetical protein
MVTLGGAVSAFYSTSCVVRLSNSKYRTVYFLLGSLFDREDGRKLCSSETFVNYPIITLSHVKIWYYLKILC